MARGSFQAWKISETEMPLEVLNFERKSFHQTSIFKICPDNFGSIGLHKLT